MSNGVIEAIMLLNAANSFHCQIRRFYIVVSIGLLSFRFSDIYGNLPKEYKLVVIIGYIVFSVYNYIFLRESMIRFNTVLSVLKKYQFQDQNSIDLTYVFSQYTEIKRYIVFYFQLIMSCLVVFTCIIY